MQIDSLLGIKAVSMRAKLGAKPLYPHQQHWTKLGKNRAAQARHPYKATCEQGENSTL